MKVVTVKNVDCLRPLIAQWLKEANDEFGFDLDVEVYLTNLQQYADGSESDVLGLVNGTDEVVGYMGICCMDNPLGGGKFANEHTWFVAPEHRGISSMRLLEAAVAWTKEKGCTHFVASASRMASALHDRVCALYQAKGMAHFETSYICKVN